MNTLKGEIVCTLQEKQKHATHMFIEDLWQRE